MMLQIFSSGLDDSGLHFWPVPCQFHDIQMKTQRHLFQFLFAAFLLFISDSLTDTF